MDKQYTTPKELVTQLVREGGINNIVRKQVSQDLNKSAYAFLARAMLHADTDLGKKH